MRSGALGLGAGNGLSRSSFGGSVSASSDLLRVPGDASVHGRTGDPSKASLNDSCLYRDIHTGRAGRGKVNRCTFRHRESCWGRERGLK